MFWLCGGLIIVDLFFILVYFVNEFDVITGQTVRPPVWNRWNIGRDRSYAELFGYLKILLIIAAMLSILRVWQRPVYLAFIGVFLFVLMDDALRLHETFGGHLAVALDLRPPGNLRPQDAGELLVWAIAGVPLLSAVAVTILRASREDRRNGLLLLAGLAALTFFAAAVDMAHMALHSAFAGADALFTLIEDGGEQIVLSLICGLAVLIHREVRGREPRGKRFQEPFP